MLAQGQYELARLGQLGQGGEDHSAWAERQGKRGDGDDFHALDPRVAWPSFLLHVGNMSDGCEPRILNHETLR